MANMHNLGEVSQAPRLLIANCAIRLDFFWSLQVSGGPRGEPKVKETSEDLPSG